MRESYTCLDHCVRTAVTKSKSFLGPTTIIEIESPRDYFTNGDLINGKLVIDAQKSFSVKDIQIKLRCEELARVIIHTSNGNYTEKERLRYLAPWMMVFPDEKLLENRPPNSEGKYTLGAGTHEFPFCFRIPESGDYPESWYSKQADCGVTWFIKGVIHNPKSLSLAKRVNHEFQMRSTKSFAPDSSETASDTLAEPFTTYLEGYAAHRKAPMNVFKDMVSGGNSEFKQETNVSLTVIRPASGLSQDPKPLNIQIDLNCTDQNLVVVGQLKVELKCKTKVRISAILVNTYRDKYTVLNLKNINLAFKDANKFIESEIEKTTIKKKIPATLNDDYFESNYKLVVTAQIFSLEKRSSNKKLRLSVPVTVRPHIPGGETESDSTGESELPAYEALPGSGETILNPEEAPPASEHPSKRPPQQHRPANGKTLVPSYTLLDVKWN